MIQEDYVSLETAKLLKDKGFNWKVHRSYLVNDNCFAPANVDDLPRRKDAIRIPTLQMAMKWLREVHSLYVDISFNRFNKTYHFNIVQYYQYDNKNKPYIEQTFYVLDNMFDSYEKAIESAIKYCLENLI